MATVGWTITDLSKEGLITRVGRNAYVITEEGRRELGRL